MVHSVFLWMGDSAGAIYQSRVLTMASTSTRKAPNCFNYLRQLRKLTSLGCSPEAHRHEMGRASPRSNDINWRGALEEV